MVCIGSVLMPWSHMTHLQARQVLTLAVLKHCMACMYRSAAKAYVLLRQGLATDSAMQSLLPLYIPQSNLTLSD